jgi:regulator of protease activity HflC (stomatin/prohibitin superfamily)
VAFNVLDDPAYIALRPLLERHHPGVSHADVRDIRMKEAHSGGLKFAKAIVAPVLFTVGLPTVICLTGKAIPFLVPEGHIGLSTNNGRPEFLPEGWHWLLSPVRRLDRVVSLKQDVIEFNTKAIITIHPGHIGYAEDQGCPIVLGPGMHQWDSPTIKFMQSFDISEKFLKFGPYTLLTVREGECAVTSNNGVLEILGADKPGKTADKHQLAQNPNTTRTYLLSHAKWTLVAWLNITEQFDMLKSAEILTNDRVEVDLNSTVAWRIVDASVAAKQGGGMDHIRELVHREARATVADLILSTKISSGIQAPESRVKTMSHKGKGRDEASASASPIVLDGVPDDSLKAGVSETAVDACSKRLERIGVHVDTINIVQLTIKDKLIRERLAQAAVISTKVQETSEIAKTEAKNVEIHARAVAEAARLKARAEADAIEFIAEARAKATKLHADAMAEAGRTLNSSAVAAQLETIRVTGEALSGASSTIFLQPGQDITHLMANPAVIQSGRKSGTRAPATNGTLQRAGPAPEDEEDDDEQ